jgi:hypothetical protein
VPIIRRNNCVYTTDSHPHRITSTKGRINTVVSPDDGHIVTQKIVEIDKYTKNKLYTKLALFATLCRDARSTKHKTTHNITEYAITNE